MLQIKDFVLNSDFEELLNISELTINRGDYVLLVGENCSGKSLLLKTINKSYKNFLGEIIIKKKSIFSSKKRNSIMIEREPKILLEKTVWENIILPIPKLKSKVKNKIEELSEILNLKKKINVKTKFLSYSEKKKIELIRAFVQYPYLILIDDFDKYFDEISLVNVQKILQNASSLGIVILATSTKKIPHFSKYLRIRENQIESL